MKSRIGELLPDTTPPAALRATLVICLAALLAPIAAAAADSAKPATDGNDCVFSGTINDWRPLDDRHLVIWAPNRKDAYLVSLSFPLTNLKSRESMAIIDNNGDGRLCGYGMDQIVIGGGPYPEKSTVMGMTKLDEAGLAALGEQYNVKLVRPAKGEKDE
jgi:Family of unknown function (DUF6491)